jgi:hypothetical protein
MPELIAPTTRLRTAWLEAHAEWGPGPHEDGFGLGPSDDVDSPTGFAAWVARLTGESYATKSSPAGCAATCTRAATAAPPTGGSCSPTGLPTCSRSCASVE